MGKRCEPSSGWARERSGSRVRATSRANKSSTNYRPDSSKTVAPLYRVRRSQRHSDLNEPHPTPREREALRHARRSLHILIARSDAGFGGEGKHYQRIISSLVSHLFGFIAGDIYFDTRKCVARTPLPGPLSHREWMDRDDRQPFGI